MHENRLSLRPTLETIKRNGFPVVPTPENLAERYDKNPEQYALDLYAFLAIAIEAFVPPMTDEPPRPARTFTELEQQATSRLYAAISRYSRIRERQEPDPFTILAQMRKHDPEGLLVRGTNTATNFMNGTLRALPLAYRQTYGGDEPEPDTLITLARNNYRFIAANAKQHLADFAALSDFGKSKYAPSLTTAFSYLEIGADSQLSFSDKMLSQLPDAFQTDRPLTAYTITRPPIGCPALYSPAMKSLWDWHLVGAERIYRRVHEEAPKEVFSFAGSV